MKKALIIVDYQNDFANPKGSLYIHQAEKIYPYIEQLILKFKENNDFIIATKDWHPENHISFKQWPKHCIKKDKGSELYKIKEKDINKIIYKGVDADVESYGAFFDDKNKSNGFDEYLKNNKIEELLIVGLAGEFCVKKTFNQAKKLGYKVSLDFKGIKNINNK